MRTTRLRSSLMRATAGTLCLAMAAGPAPAQIRPGAADRAKVLGRGKDQATRDAIAKGMERLAAPKAMGTLFKVLAVSSPGLKLPIFDPIEIGERR